MGLGLWGCSSCEPQTPLVWWALGFVRPLDSIRPPRELACRVGLCVRARARVCVVRGAHKPMHFSLSAQLETRDEAGT